MTVDGAQIENGILGATLETVTRLLSRLPLQPTPTARCYEEVAYWADVEYPHIMTYVLFSNGGWGQDPAGLEFVCQHVLARINADFGTAFTLDDFQEHEDCTCEN